MVAWGKSNLSCDYEVVNLTRCRYAQEYHVERYLRECFVPRIAPVSRVGIQRPDNALEYLNLRLSGDDHELYRGKGSEPTAKLLTEERSAV